MPRRDTGISNERTELAWQRTALSLVAGSAIITRLTFDRLGTIAFVALLAALPLSLWVLVDSRLRYRRDQQPGRPVGPRGGFSAAALALGTVAVTLVELAALVRTR
jgi:uncharacterized membrane protein YidH (DUF202 family)